MSEGLAPMRAQVYKDPRPKEYFDPFHERSRTREPDAVYEVVRMVTSIWAWTAFRARCISADHVPASGPVILAPNHFSFMDHFLMGAFLRRKMRFMAKSQMFKPGLLQWIYTHGGVFPVRRGLHDEEVFITAETILARGGAVVMYCEGGRSRTGKLSDTAKPGIGRLALDTGAPIVPVAIHGSAKARNWKRLQFPKVTVQYGEPMHLGHEPDASRDRHQEVADEIFSAIKALYGGLDQHGRRGVVQRVREQRRADRRSRRTATA
jgi:1-acyl-sn-glycerol-3-phosphate acyltransferase